MTFHPTEEQHAIVETVKGDKNNLAVIAYAGCAKTTTLTMAAQCIQVPALAVAFNKKIADELRPRFPSNFDVKTMNALGHFVWGQFCRKRGFALKLDKNKLHGIISQTIREQSFPLSKGEWQALTGLLNHAQSAGLVPHNAPQEGIVLDTPETWGKIALSAGVTLSDLSYLKEIARDILKESNLLALKGIISFNDQVYCPIVFNLPFPQYPFLLVDEAQDLSPLNHEMLLRSIRPDGRLVMVGDPKQAIYAFRGASSDSMQLLSQRRQGWEEKALTLTFRCPHIVVERQQVHAPGFTAAEGNKKGEVLEWPRGASWEWGDVLDVIDGGGKSFVFLCRYNAPLMSLGFKLLRQGVGITFAGRDIGKGLILLSKKIAPSDQLAIEAYGEAIDSWVEKEMKNLPEGGLGREIILDKAECLRAVLDVGVTTAGEARLALEKIFASEGQVLLSSIHKAKGLEWEVVFHLDWWRLPSKKALKEAAEEGTGEGAGKALEQENNLNYVAETRALGVLVLCSLGDFT